MVVLWSACVNGERFTSELNFTGCELRLWHITRVRFPARRGTDTTAAYFLPFVYGGHSTNLRRRRMLRLALIPKD